MIERFKDVLGNEEASSGIEMVVIMSVIIVICGFLFFFMASTLDLGKSRSDISRDTGWFRDHDVNGIAKSAWIVN